MLSEKQKLAVEHKEGALLILAGAGAGKTRVIVHRIAELIRGGVPPESIAAVTFTNKAAAEMRDRLGKILERDLSLSPFDRPRHTPFIGTFHALSLMMIKTFHEEVGLPKRFSILDRSDSEKSVKAAIVESGFDPKALEPRRVLGIMSRAKGDGYDRDTWMGERASSYVEEAIGEVWERYDKAKRREHSLDFDDILIMARQLLSKPGPNEHFTKMFTHLMVDEYQDTNRVQYELVKQLAAHRGNVAVVGDIDQNIYSWRGASIEHIMNFERDYPNATVIVLDENYRSTKTILAAANDAIQKNTRRREKNLHTKNPDGEPIRVAGFSDETEEARFIARECADLIRSGVGASEIAVLYRANFQSRAIEEQFLARGVPYQVLGTRFFERKEIKDAIAHVRYALNPASVTDFVRAVASPTQGLGKVALAKIVQGGADTLPLAQKEKYRIFQATHERIRIAIETQPASAALRTALAESGLMKQFETGIDEDTERLENLKELVSVASKYDGFTDGSGIERLLEEAALQSDQDELKDARAETEPGVKLMTVHAAKGLEFDTVFVTGLEEGLFPHERDDSENADNEEERRLFYVAVTRAKRLLYVSYAASRRIFGSRIGSMPSEFIRELDPAYVSLVSVPMSGFELDEII